MAIRSNYFESQLDTLLERDLKLVYATHLPCRTLEAIFLIRIFSTEGGKKSPIAFLEDQGMATHLSNREPELTHFPDLVRGLYANILPQFLYRHELAASFFQYRTRGGAYIPLEFRTKKGVVGIVPVVGRDPTLASLKSSESFLKRYLGSHVVIGCSESERPKNIHERLHVRSLVGLL